ncbi:hypothetical protein GEV33_012357 [Tenebrio molitor]|uniref:Uncharacterized protein n=1 Tax=Tenebrio molitor TaxID=7067 RepID=A0A8J6H9E5_TENMO|nr:hypothetical protein GEV33_012357 [Tenebrio molitor]
MLALPGSGKIGSLPSIGDSFPPKTPPHPQTRRPEVSTVEGVTQGATSGRLLSRRGQSGRFRGSVSRPRDEPPLFLGSAEFRSGPPETIRNNEV